LSFDSNYFSDEYFVPFDTVYFLETFSTDFPKESSSFQSPSLSFFKNECSQFVFFYWINCALKHFRSSVMGGGKTIGLHLPT